MAISNGASSSFSGFNTAGPTFSWTHTPGTAPKAIVVAVITGNDDADLVTGVTYGGVAMTRRVRAVDTTGTSEGNKGSAVIYDLLSGIPAGAQSVVVTRTGTSPMWAACVDQLANAAIEVLDTDTAAATADPTLAGITHGGRTGLVVAGLYTGAPAASNVIEPNGFGRPQQVDFGNYAGAIYRQSVATDADASYLWDQANGNSALAGVLYAEVVTAPAASTSDFCCGAECGLTGPGTLLTPTEAHWHEVGTTPPIVQTDIARNLGRAYRFSPQGSTSYLGRASTGTQRWHRAYFYFASYPDKNAAILRYSVAAGDAPGVIFRTGTNDIVPAIGNTVGAQAKAIVLGRWYRIETLADVSTGTRTLKLRVCEASQADPWADGASTALTDATLAQAASSFTGWRIGASAQTSPTFDVVVDDTRTGTDPALYPVGPAAIVGLSPTGDGTHNFNAAGDFKYTSGTNVAVGATDTWNRVAGLLSDAPSSYLQAAGVSAGEYLEWTMPTPAMSSVSSVEIVSLHLGGGATPANAHKQTLRWREGGVDTDVMTDEDFSEATAVQHSKHFNAPPSGGSLTPAKVGAGRFRWGSSWTAVDLDSIPIIAGLLLEVDGILTSTPPPPPDNPERNPVHTFPAPGTYAVTLTVRDDQGATSSVTQQVTVP